MPASIENLQEKLGISFADLSLLRRALTHSSAVGAQAVGDNYERLEFLGDAVLGLVIADALFSRAPDFSEGELSKVRSQLINESALADVANSLDLGDYLILGRGEEQTDGRKKPAILADTVESLLGAVYLDQGLEQARELILRFFGERLSSSEVAGWIDNDYKTVLQELCQERFQLTPFYEVSNRTGPAHDPMYTVVARIDKRVLGTGQGSSKKTASQDAARRGLQALVEEA